MCELKLNILMTSETCISFLTIHNYISQSVKSHLNSIYFKMNCLGQINAIT